MDNLFFLLAQSKNRYDRKTALQIRDGEEGWRRLSYRELHDSTVALAQALRRKGFGEGDPIAILSENRPEWGIAFFSILGIGGVVVPLDKLLKKEEIQFILEIAKPKLIMTSKHFLNLLAGIPFCPPVLSLDHDDQGEAATLAGEIQEGLQSSLLPMPRASADSTAVMIFTSGTTGKPKGVMLTHRNFLSNLASFYKIFPASFFKSNFLSILPLNHAFELTAGFLTPLYGGGTITYQDSLKPSQVLRTMQETSTQIILVVPAFLEVLYRNLLHQISQSLSLQKKFSLGLKLSGLFPFRSFRRWLFREIHARFGGKLQCFVSGGAPLSGKLQEEFEKLGFKVIQGYGLTETAPVLTVNPFRRTKPNSVGKPIPGVLVKIDGGEILAKGPNIMKGYYEDPKTTELLMKDGYFRTGDLGYFDRDGYLYISGRLKNVIVTSAGKKVFPEELEEKLKALPYVKEVCVLGRKTGVQEKVTAAVVPDFERAEAEKIPMGELRGRIWDGIKKVNAGMADYKHVKELILFEEEFPKTTTMKVKRRELEERI